MDFYQTPPELRNQYLTDRVLINYQRRVLPSEILESIEPDLFRKVDPFAMRSLLSGIS